MSVFRVFHALWHESARELWEMLQQQFWHQCNAFWFKHGFVKTLITLWSWGDLRVCYLKSQDLLITWKCLSVGVQEGDSFYRNLQHLTAPRATRQALWKRAGLSWNGCMRRLKNDQWTNFKILRDCKGGQVTLIDLFLSRMGTEDPPNRKKTETETETECTWSTSIRTNLGFVLIWGTSQELRLW